MIGIKIEIEQKNEYLKKLDRLEELIKEMRDILTWDLRTPTLTIKELPEDADSSSEVNQPQ